MGECLMFGRGKLQTLDPVFANNEWTDIIAACQSGRVPETWVVGDQKTMTINGTEYLIDIIGKNHDTYSDGSGTAPLTFQMHDCYETTYRMRTSGSNTVSWKNTNMRATYLPAILALMPSEVQAGIKEINKDTAQSGTNSTIVTTADKLFLLSEVEVFGTTANSNIGEGEQYSYYYAGNNKVKYCSGTKTMWWERSPLVGGTTSYAAVETLGASSGGEATLYYGVAFAFCF